MRFLEMLITWSINLAIVAAIFFGVWMWGKNSGIVEGRNMALKTNPPSDELELVCAGLWVGEQNKKYWEKTK